MSDDPPKLDYEPAKIFNDLQRDLGARINTFINHLLVLDAGILSITIGAFLGIQPPRFAPDALASLRTGWWLLTIALICALTAAFCVLAAQTIVQDSLRNHYKQKLDQPEAQAGLKVFAGPTWFRGFIRVLIVLAFLGTVAGIAFISVAASQMLRIL
ncbi:hypothetical protein [Variovorax saccharolyticus]|uniref:hypothetical protein n=1 Tax=Variovorax saccharolyticus TaxID=3053516 RepID=UPI002575D819|nr:hypothetical protein [Variovorax sp. J31P216]MDM0029826.1 hypothetical protein [Variovorax sp. J31P216]